MMRTKSVLLAAVCGLALPAAAVAQEKGTWRPVSKTATAITGPVTFGNEKLTINFASFAIAEIRALSPAEAGAAFDGETAQTGHLYRLSIPAEQRFLHKNTMCGAEETQWMVTAVAGKELRLAFFSGSQMPTLTAEAIGNSTALCGTYGYTR